MVKENTLYIGFSNFLQLLLLLHHKSMAQQTYPSTYDSLIIASS